MDGVEAELERKPLEVLIYLLQHAGEICTKDELLANVWPGRILSETSLAKCVGRLREVLGDESQSIIKTVHGFGYRFVAPVQVESIQTAEPPRFDFRPGDHPPGRPLWNLVERLGLGGHGEAWRGRHEKTREQRVFKFAVDEAALGALKREITLFRVINDTLGDEARVVKLLDWNLEQQPCFIESEYIAGGSLADWAQGRGGLATMPLAERLGIAAAIADALASVHSVGVLHKDLKPSNILVVPDSAGSAAIKLADFGSGSMLDVAELERMGITRLGFTRTVAVAAGSSGTPMYLAPEVLGGQPFTVKSDVYALGVILYQLVTGNFRKLMASGWEHDIAEELLREDIADTTAGDAALRLADAAELARRLRTLQSRTTQREREREAKRRAELAQRALERSHARRLGLGIAFAFLLIGFAVSTVLFLRARQAQFRAEKAVATAQAVSGFLSADLFGPIAKLPVTDLTVSAVLKAGTDRISRRFKDDPDVAADLHAALAGSYLTLKLSQLEGASRVQLSKGPLRDPPLESVLETSAAHIDLRFKGEPDIDADLHAALGSTFFALGLPEVKRELPLALNIYEERQGVGSEQGMGVLAQMLTIQYPPEDYTALVCHAVRALAEGRRRYGEANMNVLQLRVRLAAARTQLGEMSRAIDELRSLAQDMDRYAPQSGHFGGKLSRILGYGLLMNANFDEAEHWLLRARTEALLDADRNPQLIGNIHLNLGDLYRETQRFTASKQELDAAAEILKDWVQPDSVLFMLVTQSLGELRLAQGSPEDAIFILEKLLPVAEAAQGKDDLGFSAQMLYDLGLAYQQQKNLPVAIKNLREALQRAVPSYGAADPETLQIRIGLADALRLQGHLDQASRELDEVAASNFPGLPSDHPRVAELRRVQGLLLQQQGRRDEARIALAEALRIYTARYGAHHWRSLRARQELALIV